MAVIRVVIVVLLFAVLMAEFSDEVRGKPTVVGCFLAELHGVEKPVCD